VAGTCARFLRGSAPPASSQPSQTFSRTASFVRHVAHRQPWSGTSCSHAELRPSRQSGARACRICVRKPNPTCASHAAEAARQSPRSLCGSAAQPSWQTPSPTHAAGHAAEEAATAVAVAAAAAAVAVALALGATASSTAENDTVLRDGGGGDGSSGGGSTGGASTLGTASESHAR
jgi:hypothetical protein